MICAYHPLLAINCQQHGLVRLTLRHRSDYPKSAIAQAKPTFRDGTGKRLQQRIEQLFERTRAVDIAGPEFKRGYGLPVRAVDRRPQFRVGPWCSIHTSQHRTAVQLTQNLCESRYILAGTAKQFINRGPVLLSITLERIT